MILLTHLKNSMTYGPMTYQILSQNLAINVNKKINMDYVLTLMFFLFIVLIKYKVFR